MQWEWGRAIVDSFMAFLKISLALPLKGEK